MNKILIPDIPKEGLDVEIQDTIEAGDVTAPIKARLKIEKVGAEVAVTGEMQADLKLRCSRCLKEFQKEMSIPIDVVYHPVEELKGEERHEIAAEELDMDFYSGEELDLVGLLHEQVMLNITMKPLCNERCKGICPRCGADLNVEGCDCAVKDVDPRLAKLRELLH